MRKSLKNCLSSDVNFDQLNGPTENGQRGAQLHYVSNNIYENKYRTPSSFVAVVFTILRPTLGRTHRQTDKAKTICPADVSQAE